MKKYTTLLLLLVLSQCTNHSISAQKDMESTQHTKHHNEDTARLAQPRYYF